MSDFVSVVFITKIYIHKIGHKIGRKIGHEIGPVLGHVSAARQGDGGEKGGEDVSPHPRGIVGGGPVGRGSWERRGDHSRLSDGTVGRSRAVGQRQLWQGRLVREDRRVMVRMQAMRKRHV